MSDLSAIPPVVDVITGTDWASIIASIATGVAAIVGIGGTAYLAKRASNDAKKSLDAASNDAKANREAASSDLQASIKAATEQLVVSINAEDKRAYVAEKRRIYAKALAAMNEVVSAATAYRVARSDASSEEERKPIVARQTKAQEDMFGATGELSLIAPRDVAEKADALQNAMVQFMVASHRGAPFADPKAVDIGVMRTALHRSMRIDLGEPV